MLVLVLGVPLNSVNLKSWTTPPVFIGLQWMMAQIKEQRKCTTNLWCDSFLEFPFSFFSKHYSTSDLIDWLIFQTLENFDKNCHFFRTSWTPVFIQLQWLMAQLKEQEQFNHFIEVFFFYLKYCTCMESIVTGSLFNVANVTCYMKERCILQSSTNQGTRLTRAHKPR